MSTLFLVEGVVAYGALSFALFSFRQLTIDGEGLVRIRPVSLGVQVLLFWLGFALIGGFSY